MNKSLAPLKRSDPDKLATWVKYKSGMCRDCWAGCCRMPVEANASDLMRMGLVTEDEAAASLKTVARRLEKEGVIKSYRANTGIFMLSLKANGDCLFLDSKTRLCTIYEKRPTVCRKFPTSIGSRPGFCPAGPKISAPKI